jgi:UDP-3-O-[3-hydroxymyristoyl] N-acetylglucosamine deacetylase
MTNGISQRTLKTVTRCSGVALHSGDAVEIALHPAAVDTGIVFRRVDLGGTEIAASWRHVADAPMCTAVTDAAGNRVCTIEHLLAAFAGCGIDNAVVEIDGPELPVMDGSAGPFVFLIDCAGTVQQDAPRRAIRVLRPVEVADAERVTRLLPADGFSVTVEIDYPTPPILRQRFTVTLDRFRDEVARARTYGFLHEVESLHAAGLARGASLLNAVVVSGETVVNEDGLRYSNEFVRHKALDAFGDLYLAGAPIIGRFEGIRSGHRMNHRLLAALFATPDAWCWEPADSAPAARPATAAPGLAAPGPAALEMPAPAVARPAAARTAASRRRVSAAE